MSSPKAARKASAPKRVAKPAKRPLPKIATAQPTRMATSDTTVQARTLAADLEHALAAGRAGELAPEVLQDLMAALCKNYSAQVQAGNQILPLRGRTTVTSTDIMTTASGLLKAANLAVFELGMWQSWTGR